MGWWCGGLQVSNVAGERAMFGMYNVHIHSSESCIYNRLIAEEPDNRKAFGIQPLQKAYRHTVIAVEAIKKNIIAITLCFLPERNDVDRKNAKKEEKSQ